ncbi:hypothetical protein HMPREF0870_01429 [Veillonella atypica KON]|uniref:Uncharacterized protein n=1 Tax=Veillonella atypica KON TaxID=1128111 RepID=A0ABN0IJF3_9FIRM|nr:hypothetical protein HMPREF0870_01429 [Veillonella atypica KON]
MKVFCGSIILGNVSAATENYFQNKYNKNIFNIVIIYCIY